MIDMTFDFRSDAGGRDPDAYSPTLRKYHRLLWSKPVPAGGSLVLDKRLINQSELGRFEFTSDSIIHSFAHWARYQYIIKEIPAEDIEEFIHIGYSIGGMTIFPGNKVDRKHSINQARGTSPYIADRIDLTLECIRRYYLDIDSPLYACLCRYRDFSDLFVDFKGYIDFFMFQDMVSDDYNSIRFLHPFEEFQNYPLPPTVADYLTYKDHAIQFVQKRNERIRRWSEENLKC